MPVTAIIIRATISLKLNGCRECSLTFPVYPLDTMAKYVPSYIIIDLLNIKNIRPLISFLILLFLIWPVSRDFNAK